MVIITGFGCLCVAVFDFLGLFLLDCFGVLCLVVLVLVGGLFLGLCAWMRVASIGWCLSCGCSADCWICLL